ncbi:hypothetical protein [Arthrobacter crystallopoietes]|uniref:hypothetical protein n=1 Tax=Crystallibacter crystallopoietes TaxID=37928 RepID=UPI0011111E66|nr:hypothetical protein [Arthrobacter crystallopoietes]
MSRVWSDAMKSQIFRFGATPNGLGPRDNLFGSMGQFLGNTAVSNGWTLQNASGAAVAASVTARKVNRTFRGEQREVQEIKRTVAADQACPHLQNTAVGEDWNPGDNVTFSLTVDYDPVTDTSS